MDSPMGDIDAWLAEGLRHYSGGEPARALEAWYRILDIEPAHALAQQYVAYVQEVYRLEPAGGSARPASVPAVNAAPPGATAARPVPAPAVYVEAATTVPAPATSTSSWSDLVDSAFDVPVPAQAARAVPNVPVEVPRANPWAPKPRAAGQVPAEVPAPPPLAPPPLAPPPLVPQPLAPPRTPAAATAAPAMPAADPWGAPSMQGFDPWAGTSSSPEPVAIPAPSLPLPPPTSPGPDDWSDVAFVDDVPSPPAAAVEPQAPGPVSPAVDSPAPGQQATKEEAAAWSGTYRLKGGGKTEIGGDIHFVGDDAGFAAQPAAPVQADVGAASPAPRASPASSAPAPAPDDAADVIIDDVGIDPWGGDAEAPPLDLDTAQSEPNALDALLGTQPPPVPGVGSSDVDVDLDVDGSAIVEEDESEALMRGARELFELGDFSGSLELVEKVLAKNPNHEGALSYLHRNEQTLMKMFESKIGALDRSPRPLMPPDEVIWLNMHHKAGFLLSQVDGQLSYDELIEVSGMPRFNTLRILSELVQQGIIG